MLRKMIFANRVFPAPMRDDGDRLGSKGWWDRLLFQQPPLAWCMCMVALISAV